MLDRAVKKSILINDSVSEVWKHITNPDAIRKFLFNAEVRTSWKQGDPIEFRGNWKGRDYEGKGKIIRIEKNKVLEYTYYSNLSDQPDEPANYCRVIYTVEEKENKTVLSITQTDVIAQDEFDQVGGYWQAVLDRIKCNVEAAG